MRTVIPGARVRVHHGGAVASLTWSLAMVFRWLRSGYGVIYAPFPQSMLLAQIAIGLGGRHARLIAGLQGTPIPESVAAWKRFIYRFALGRLLANRAVTVVAVSRAQLDDAFTVLGRQNDARGVVIGNVAHSVGDAPWVESRTSQGQQNGLGPVAVVLARLSWEKGVDVAIRALSHTDPPLRLKIGGDGPQRAELERLAVSVGVAERVTFVGWCDSRDLLAEASVVLIPSRREGLPAVLLEAAWQRVPIVASAVGGIPEIAQGLACVALVQPDDETALATAMVDALDRPPPKCDPTADWHSFRTAVEGVLA